MPVFKPGQWPLHAKMILGLVLGFVWAWLAAWLGFASFSINWLHPFGLIFIRALKLLALPLILFSIIAGIASLPNVRQLGRMGLRTLGLYLLTTVIAVSTGLLVVNLVKPGGLVPAATISANHTAYLQWKQALPDTLNPATPAGPAVTPAGTPGPLGFLVDMVPENLFASLSSQGSMLQIILFAVFFGIALGQLPAGRKEELGKVVQQLNEVLIAFVNMVMQASPFLVFALVAGTMATMAQTVPQLLHLFAGLGWYSLCVVTGLALVLFVMYPMLLRYLGGVSQPFTWLKALRPAQLLGFTTCSTAATLPVTLRCMDTLHIPRPVSSFVLPIGATINMDGTSLYQAVAVVFLAQLHGIQLEAAQQATIVLTATLASIGAASVPGSGMVMLLMVLQSVGLNPAWVAIILPVDRLLDMCRTVLNVTGDALVATVVATHTPTAAEE